jgi:F-type H+-transporting ATPase subunit delta
MADRSTIARPYARAAFQEARADKRLGPWFDALNTGAAVVQDERVQNLLGDPLVTPAQLAQLVIDIAGPGLGEHGVTPVKNFVQTLAENRRLGYLPEIAAIFGELKDAEEGIVDVTVTSAAPLDQQQQLTLSEALARKLKRQVRLHCETDKALIGGAVLRAGDLVIDGSLRTRLDRIATELTA